MKLFRLLAIPASAVILGALALALAVPAHADTITWTNWSSATGSSATGTMGGVGVTYSGQIVSVVANYPSWGPSTTFSGGTIDNAPPQSGGIIHMTGGSALPESIAFSSPVVDPVIAIWSLGQAPEPASFNFTTSNFSIQACGPATEYAGQCITQVGNVVWGAEGNGVIQFTGTFSEIDFTTPNFEDWYGFTVGAPSGVPPVPEPGTLSLLGLGLAALPLLRSKFARRRG